jgi:aryl-alcohol dehydrogenase-like predicted oxidoreductase
MLSCCSACYSKPLSDEECFAVLDKALALGETFWDTADVYFDNEDLLGIWFKRTGERSQTLLAIKFANTHEKDTEGRYIIRSDAAYVKESCEKSLKRLGVDCIDLYYCQYVFSK